VTGGPGPLAWKVFAECVWTCEREQAHEHIRAAAAHCARVLLKRYGDEVYVSQLFSI